MLAVDLKGFDRDGVILAHVTHELVHGRGHAVFRRKNGRTVCQLAGNNDVLDLVAKYFLHLCQQIGEALFVFLGQGGCLGLVVFLVCKSLKFLVFGFLDGLDIPFLVLALAVHDKFIKGFIEEEHLDALFAEAVHVGIDFGSLAVGGCHKPDGLLAFKAALHVVVKACVFLIIVGSGGIEAQKGQQAITVHEVLLQAELEEGAVVVPEFFVFFRSIGSHLFQVRQGLLDDCLVDFAQDAVFLQGLS